jgi:hypothetical protein
MRRIITEVRYVEYYDIPDEITDDGIIDYIKDKSSKIQIKSSINILKASSIEEDNFIELPEDILFDLDNGINDY